MSASRTARGPREPRYRTARHSETPQQRLALVLGGECVFATLVYLIVGSPPAFITTIAFGVMLALIVERS